MNFNTSNPHRRNFRTFVAGLLTYMLLTSQLAPLALGFNGPLTASPDKSSEIDKGRTEPSDASTTATRNTAFAPVPKPLVVAAAAVAPIITATKTDSFADSDGDGKAEPGEVITYSITVNNTGPDPALNLTLNDTVDPNTTIVGGSVHSTPIAFNDAFNVLGNVRIQVPDGASDLLANDTDPENPGNSNAGLTITTLAGDNSAPFSGTSANNGQVTATTGDGSFQYNPAPGFTGTDTFTYTATDSTGGGTTTATVTLTVTGLIWFVNSAANPGGDGRLTSPFNCLVGAGCFDPVAVDDPGDNIFLYSGSYTGGLTLLNNQKLLGAGASQPLETIAGVTVPTFSDALPPTGQAFPAVTTAIAATNAVNIGPGASNTLRGFNIGNTTGAKIASGISPPAAAFGTLTISEMTLSGTGQALNLDNGTLAATFTSITSTSSAAQGINLDQIVGSLTSTGGTTISGSTSQCLLVSASTANMNFGNTSCSGGTVGVSLQNNTGGTRTFGTLSISNNSGIGFLSTAGGNATITGATLIPAAAQTAPVGTAIDIQSLATGTAVTFSATTVNKGNAGTGVNLGGAVTGNIGNVTFNSLAITTANGSGLVGTGNSGQINVTTNAGSIASTNGPAINITKAGAPATPITLNFTNLSSTNSTTQGINIDRVSGNLTAATTTVTNATGTGIQVLNTSAGGTMTFGTTAVNGTGNASVDATGTGVFLNANAGNITFGDLDILPDNLERAFQSTASTGTITTTSGDISASGNVTLDIVGVSLASRTVLAMTLNNLDSLNSNGLGVNFNFVSGNFTVNDATLATNIQNPAGIGLQVLNSTGGTMNFGNSSVTGSGGISVSLGTAGNGNASNITFADLDISPDATQKAFVAVDNTGTLTVTSGSITTSGAGNRAVEIDGPAGRTPINIQFTTITTAGATNSISVVDVSGTKFQVTGTTQINTRAGTGVFIDNSTATSIQFATVNIPNPNAAGGYGIRVEDSSSPVTVATATISDANLTVAQADGVGIPGSDGDGDAIFLTNNTGAFTLNGGTLSNCGNDCIDLRNSPGLVLSAVTINTSGLDVTGATGAGAGGHGISAFNLTGTSTITGGTISGFNVANRDGIYLINNVATALTFTLTNVVFQNGIGNRGFGINGRAAANMTVNVTTCTFQNILGTALQSLAGADVASTSTVNLTVTGSTFQNSPLNGKTNLIAGLNEAGKSNVVLTNNTFNNVFITASTGESLININNDGTLAGNQLGLSMTGNNINNVGSALNTCGGGGATACRGPLNAVLVFIDDAGNVPNALVIDNNTITNVQQGGINLDMANTGAPSSTVSAKITNNCIGRLRVAGACSGATAAVGVGVAVTVQSGIRVERRRNNSLSSNVLISGNTVRNGAGGAGSTLNSTGIFARTKANANMSVTVTNNNVDTNLTGGVAELRFDTNANDAGDIVAPTQCDDITGNTLPAGGVIDINEVNGTHNVEQASVVAVNAANPAGTTTADAGVSFNVPCAVPPPAPDPSDFNAPQPSEQANAPQATADQTALAQPAAVTNSITSKPFVSSPREEATAPETKVDLFAGLKSGVGVQTPEVDKSKSPSKDVNPQVNINPTPPVVVGDNLTWNIGTLPAGKSVTITFQVTVDNPYTGPANVSNQGTVTADGGISVLTDDPAVGGGADPTLTPIDVPVDIFIKDAKVAEPPSGTASMLFTVTLSAAATGPVSANYATANGGATPATGGTCAGGADYETTSGTVSFIAGQQVQTIAIPVCSDATAEGDETFLVNLSTPTNGNISDGQATGTITANTPGVTLISELRTSGPSGTNDDFVEVYNNTDSPLTVTASDASAGYGVFKKGAACGDTPVLLGIIPNGTVIPARGHYLLVGSAYSLANYGGTAAAAGNLTMSSDIENDRNVALFNTANVVNISSTTRLDAVGFGTNTGNNCDLLREGTNLGAASGSTSEHSFVRKLATGTPQDTNDNVADFVVITTTPATPVGANAAPGLGGPGPENLASPIQRNATIKASLIDTGVSSTTAPNRVRDTTPDPANNSTLGTLLFRRKFTNNTGAPVTRLRFRIVDVTTFPVPGGTADLRARTIGPATVTITGGSMITVQGTVLETPPAQPNAGGFNSTLSAGTVTLATPIAAGASINVQFLTGVQANGSFRFFINVEALP